MKRFASWWVLMWVISACSLLALAFVLPFKWWTLAAIIGFGIPEAIGLRRRSDPYPPLTDVIKRYIPRWAIYLLVYGFWGGIVSYWLGFTHPARFAVLAGLLGWLNEHFD